MPKHLKIKVSQGEIYSYDYLSRRGLFPVKQFIIDPLPYYRYDFYFSYQGREYLVEIDGQQHFRFTSVFDSSVKNFYARRRRDFLKTVVAVMSGYYIIRVAYDDLARLPDIIEEALLGHHRYYFSSEQTYSYFITTKIPPQWFSSYGQHLQGKLE